MLFLGSTERRIVMRPSHMSAHGRPRIAGTVIVARLGSVNADPDRPVPWHTSRPTWDSKTVSVEHTALFNYLAVRAPQYRAKLLEVRAEVKDWLAYIPQTFPHYTQHTVEHSEAIIGKLSKLLFHEDDPGRPVLQLSGVEAYILSAAAYLHDAGMVASDREKEEILRSNDWRSWTTGEGGGASRLRDIEEMRSNGPQDPLRNFAADRQVRFLLAEFIRRRHHRRAADVIAQHHMALGRLDYGDSVLRTTIANICVAHGLDRAELEDAERFPERREIRNEYVNVRFLAVLLRMGDLLDMRYDRACSLLLTAACPLPADSYAHWTQYQCITHQLVAPDRIELTAECANQEEHRFLHDWCSWLVEEVRAGAVMMVRAPRHKGWPAPQVSLGDGTARETIVIRPAATATYIPRKWQFELDASAVFQRLISDLYAAPEAFLRELIQNALDAMRCRMYLDLGAEGLEVPEYPTEVLADRRARYELRIALETESVKNALSNQEEAHQVLVVEDCGIGMDQEVIEKYFLQVGRSYYTTDAFRRIFPFHPISRFGVGFLSVFAVSDHVTIETLRSHVPNASPIRLTLTGPRSYLLAEKAARMVPGTRIAVRLKKPFARGQLIKLVRNWCRRVEFAIKVRENGADETIVAEGSTQWVCEMPDPSEPGALLAIRAIPIAHRGVQGDLYVVARVTAAGESWIDGRRIDWYRRRYPFASLPRKLPRYVCSQGLSRHSEANAYNFGFIADDRRPIPSDVMDRASRYTSYNPAEDVLEHAWRNVVTDHLQSSVFAKGPDGWRYAHRLASQMDTFWWSKISGMMPIWTHGTISRLTLEEVMAFETFTVVSGLALEPLEEGDEWTFPVDAASRAASLEIEGPILFSDDLIDFASALRQELFIERHASDVRSLTKTALAITWTRSPGVHETDMCAFPDPSIIGIVIPSRQEEYDAEVLLNTSHPLIQWAAWAQEQRIPGASAFWVSLQTLSDLGQTNPLLREYHLARLQRFPPVVTLTRACYLLGSEPDMSPSG